MPKDEKFDTASALRESANRARGARANASAEPASDAKIEEGMRAVRDALKRMGG